ncbi:MAG: hypothetical protein ACLVJ6_10060 [Merdibacter sp.]
MCALSAAKRDSGNLTLFIAMNLVFFTANAISRSPGFVRGRPENMRSASSLAVQRDCRWATCRVAAAGIVYDLNMLLCLC